MTRVESSAEATDLPSCNLVVVVGRETAIAIATAVASTKASSLLAAEAASISASLAAKASIPTEAIGADTTIRLVIGTVVPLNLTLRLELLQELRNLLLGLNQDLAEVFADVIVAVVEERCSLALVTDTSCATNAVNVLSDTIMLS
jgi:hypothetical protein